MKYGNISLSQSAFKNCTPLVKYLLFLARAILELICAGDVFLLLQTSGLP